MSHAAIVDAALAAMIANPKRAAKTLSEATSGKRGREIDKLIKEDARFGPPILAAFRIASVGKNTPWLVQYLGKLRFTPAATELLALWRRGDSNADQIGHALLAIDDAKTLAAMARDVTRANDTTRYEAIRAALRAPDGYTRAGYSGGPAYGFTLPTKDDDPRIASERGNPRFSELLSRAAK